MNINIKKLIEFYNSPRDEDKGKRIATAINAIIGEALLLALFSDYMSNQDKIIKVLEGVVTTGKIRGPRLDAWIYQKKENILYQTEIKNWSAHSYGFPKRKGSEDYATYWWKHIWDTGKEYFNKNLIKQLGKVTVKMDSDKICRENDIKNPVVIPLLLFWAPLMPCNGMEPLFEQLLKEGKTEFKKIMIFSASCYLQKINVKNNLNLKNEYFFREKRIFDILKEIGLNF